MFTDTRIVRTFWNWVKVPNSNEGKFHFYQFTFFHSDPTILTIPNKYYISGLKVDDVDELGDYDEMQLLRNNYEPFQDKFCTICMGKYKSYKS